MSNYWTDRTDDANQAIGDLDDPTSAEAVDVSRAYGFRALIAAVIQRLRDVEESGGGPGGETAGAARVLGPFPFAFDDVGLNDGIAFYTPTVDDILLDAWIEVTEAFDGTTPFGDAGQYDGDTYGIWGLTNPIDLGTADRTSDIPSLLTAATAQMLGENFASGNSAALLSTLQLTDSMGTPLLVSQRFLPAKFTTSVPMKVVVSQDGYLGSDPVGGTAGAGAVYLVVATPSAE
jgi:hypothetical protein